jgi:hypothetical protein
MITKKTALGVFAFVCIALLGVYATLFFRNKYASPEQVTTAAKPEAPSAVDTSDWLMYENKEYGYRFKYPKGVEEVVDGNDPRDPYADPRSTFIILRAKHFDIKAPDYKNPDSFENYEITIMPTLWYPNERTDEELVQSYIAEYGPVSEIITTAVATIAIYGEGEFAIIIRKNWESGVFEFALQGSNPHKKDVQEWLKDIDNPKLTEWVNHYPDYLRILEGVYSTFETF